MSTVRSVKMPIPARLGRRAFTVMATAAAAGLMVMAVAAVSPGSPAVTHHSLADIIGHDPTVTLSVHWPASRAPQAINSYSNEVWNA